MTKEELATLTDQELLDRAKKMKSSAIINAVLIGVMMGVIIFSIWKSTIGLFTLIPLIFAYKLFNYSKNDKALKELLKERNLNY